MARYVPKKNDKKEATTDLEVEIQTSLENNVSKIQSARGKEVVAANQSPTQRIFS